MTETIISTTPLRPRRTVLYMPGSNTRALEKAKTLDADALILDLEDAVAPGQKVEARQLVCAAVSAGGYGQKELVIRCNGLDSEWAQADIAAAAHTSANALCIPKVETPEHIQQTVKWLEQAGNQDMKIWAMIETPKAVANIQQLVNAHPRLQVLVMGTSDLSKEMRIPHTPDRIGFITALSQCVLAARCANLDIIDGVHLDLSDDDSYQSVCLQGRNLGFDGKSLIHPKQIAAANQVFGPSADDVQMAASIINAWQAANAAGQGVVVVNGKLIENLHVEEAQRTLAIADAINRLS